ncbi:MAG: ribosome maturation factor RimM [Bacteroidales bacterium]|jgi:16S rRNA processing protein RimM|nr:ribosome maturation factor RimM [Bacteroidales bacterium]
MKISECFYLGKIGKTFGYKGDLHIYFDVDEPSDYKSLKSVLIKTAQGLKSYNIERITISANRSTILFADADVPAQDAAALVGKELYLPLSMLPPLEGNKFYYHEIIGYTVIDEKEGNIGVVKEITDFSPQALLSVTSPQGREILIPLIDEFIVSLDRSKKTLYIKAPEGLIEFYS